MPAPLILPDPPDGSPAGPDLESDADFLEMGRVAKGKAETQYGNTIEPATPPDWKETARLAESLLERTRDLRVMAYAAVAQLNLRGLPGYAQYVSTIRHTLDSLWDHVHPQLDPDEPDDPMQRSNALMLLQDAGGVLRPLRDMPLATTPKTGPISWRAIAVMNGLIEAEPGRDKVSDASVRAAFAGTDPDRLAALRDAVQSVADDLTAIPAIFDTKSTYGSGPDLDSLAKLIRDIGKELDRYASAPATPDESPMEEAETADSSAAAPDRPVPNARAATIQSIVALTSRDDALRALELAATYYRVHEPSSPLPLLIDRALRLAPLPFLDILRNLAPDGLLQAQMVAGPADEAS
jgi:type VI secretion system protein ImpA